MLGDNKLHDNSMDKIFRTRPYRRGILVLLFLKGFLRTKKVFLLSLLCQVQASYPPFGGQEDLQLPWLEASVLLYWWQLQFPSS